jgi:D-ribulokinase
VVLPQTAEPVLLGAAMLGAVAGKRYDSLAAAMSAMSKDGRSTDPTPLESRRFHSRKRAVHEMLRQLDANARRQMTSPLHL